MGKAWTGSEDHELSRLVKKYGRQWGVIASKMKNRTASQVMARWEKCLDPVLVKGPFSAAEDDLIREFVKENGSHNWPRITSYLPNRSPKQCRERWFNHLDPSVVKHAWTPEEDEIIFNQYQAIGPKWSLISKSIPGRTDNAIKNRWNSSISRRMSTEKGKSILLPDKSKKRKLMASPENIKLLQEITFEPFSPTVPYFSTFENSRLNSPAPPMPGFSSTPGAFGGLIPAAAPSKSFDLIIGSIPFNK